VGGAFFGCKRSGDGVEEGGPLIVFGGRGSEGGSGDEEVDGVGCGFERFLREGEREKRRRGRRGRGEGRRSQLE